MNKPDLPRERMVTCFESKYLNVIDLNYAEGRHYYVSSRHSLEDFTVLKDEEEFKKQLPDAVTCFVIIKTKGAEPRLLLEKEFRYPTGQFLSGPPAGLLDPEDKDAPEPRVETAKREIKEETGIEVLDSDRVFVVNPLAFSTPGMTDESNALVCAVIERDELTGLNDSNAESTECFGDYSLLTKAEALKMLKDGKDERGFYYSMYTWAALMYFVSNMWKQEG
ncbi:MAG: NUDIX hydrolase [Lachnospiraceae bacterium]|nr:NUDIX hydrolase [Lachnospiraceae bacterium]